MADTNSYQDFTNRLKLLISKQPDLITLTLSNIFTMRLIGNKTHGDLAEIAVAEFINQYMYDFRSIHVGKDLYRAKTREEDIQVINEITQAEFPVSLKAYGIGPLQLSTDKGFKMFPRLEEEGTEPDTRIEIKNIFSDVAFTSFNEINVLPLIYDEKNKRCNILLFNYDEAINRVRYMVRQNAGSGRKHPVYRFYDSDNRYVCEVRYGGSNANALQRGLWTHTENAAVYFDSLTGGWVDYSDNRTLVSLFSRALVSSETGHSSALESIDIDINRLKNIAGAL